MRFILPALLLFAALAPLRAAVTHELLAHFEDPGSVPLAGLLYVSPDAAYYGTTSEGGIEGLGTIFRVTPGGTRTLLVSFTGRTGPRQGDSPEGRLVLGGDGMLYGTTVKGGASGHGTVFRIARDGTGFTTLVHFTGETGTAKGAVPNGLMLHGDGNLYGTTQAGGSQDQGTVFKMTPAGVLTTLTEFTGESGARLGSEPVGALAAEGTALYGVTESGGAQDRGVIYKVTTSGAWALMAQFTGTSGIARGAEPEAGLVLHPNGALFGTTAKGGAHDEGTVFKITTAAVPAFTTLWDFADTDGSEPAGALTVGADLALYGTTESGGSEGMGCVFRITTAPPATQTVLASFTGEDGAVPGASPHAGLAAGPDGQLAGTTSAGGIGGNGTVFSITTAGVFSHTAGFTNPDGWRVAGSPVIRTNGEFIVPLQNGGAFGHGTLWHSSAGSADPSFGSPLGEAPDGGLIEMDGTIFGVTKSGGASDRGTAFRYSAADGTVTRASFTTGGGSSPEGPLLVGADGFHYGVAREGGVFGHGAIFAIWPDGTHTTVLSFSGTGGTNPGSRPRAPLARDAAGNFYGVTERGGANDLGAVFKLGAFGAFSIVHHFASTGPNSPRGGIVAGPDGSMYGTTLFGGSANAGTVFQITPGDTVSTFAEFSGSVGNARGAAPRGPLMFAIDGTIYGTTITSGGSGFGTVFKITSAGVVSTLLDFTGSSGSVPGDTPSGDLRLGPDGKIYGHTTWGGPRGGGTVFRIAGFGPHVVTDAARFSPGKATLRGRMQSGGTMLQTHFEYGPTNALGLSTALAASAPDAIPLSHTLTGIPAGSVIFFRAVVTDGVTLTTGATRSFTMPSPLAAWGMEFFATPTPDLTGDDDKDLSTNLAEYGLVSDPTNPNPPVLPAAMMSYPDGERLAIFIPRDPARSDITIIAEAASSLAGPWDTLASSMNGLPFFGPGYVSGETQGAGLKTVEIRDTRNTSEEPSRLIRVRVIR